ncbi:MAG: Serine/threonine-protein kinase PknD [Chlamydiae bacterium]|nr:Serine/threonine-protein kinase PknD [Chlamydiota bacterium]
MNKKIGPYELIRLIAKGGMGEVFLVYDPQCKREIALKSIRPEYLEKKVIFQRFIKEAHIASQLTHPSIIPIYSLSKDSALPYYTMPYIDGSNLKKILIETLEQERDPQNIGTPVGSIQSLTRIFLTICEAVAYAHSQQIIHRDLKPENILIGKYGEVLIFDWGVADKIQNIASEDPSYAIKELEFPSLTSPGKIIGTLSFMAPERFKGAPADYQTDIYSLGVMLYMILTLKLPFNRKKLKEAKKNIDKEVLKNPIEVAPYRDIPHTLVNITQKCLSPDPKNRYQTMEELLNDLTNFIKGGSEWIEKSSLNFYSKSDWDFNENILISKHQAISQRTDAFEWICLMLSKKSYAIHMKMEMNITLEKGCAGIGLLINATRGKDRIHLFEGYDVWLSASPESNRPSKLNRNNVSLLSLPHIVLEYGVPYKIQFEQFNNRILLYINGIQQFSYLSYLDLLGTHAGLLFKDAHFKMDSIKIFISSPSLIISCLEVPRTFLANKNYDKALIEYQRIGRAFPGRHESREALFRSGLCLIGKSHNLPDKVQRNSMLDKALEEFENLKNTPGAPLEYLGKALVYRTQADLDEERKCLELAIRRYPKHPLLYLIYDHIIYRMYQCSHNNRLGTYEFILLALRYNSYAARIQMIDPLILNLANKQGVYFFLTKLDDHAAENKQILQIIINLSFLLGKVYILEETLSLCKTPLLYKNTLIALWLLGSKAFVKDHLKQLPVFDRKLFELLQKKPSKPLFSTFFELVGKSPSQFAENIFFILLDKALFFNQLNLVDFIIKEVEKRDLNIQQKESYDKLIIEYYFINRQFEEATILLRRHTAKKAKIHFDQHFLEGCYIFGTKGSKQALEFFSEDVETSIPHLGILACLYLSKQLHLKKWSKVAFDFEFMTLYRQLYLYYKTGNKEGQAAIYYEKWKKYSYYS